MLSARSGKSAVDDTQRKPSGTRLQSFAALLKERRTIPNIFKSCIVMSFRSSFPLILLELTVKTESAPFASHVTEHDRLFVKPVARVTRRLKRPVTAGR